MKIFLKILLSFSLIVTTAPYQTPPLALAQAPLPETPNGTLSDETGLNPKELTSALQSPAPPKDRFHLIQQDLIFQGQTIPLYSLGDAPLPVRYDRIVTRIEGNDLALVGLYENKEVIRHVFRNLNIHSFHSDVEIWVGATHDGAIYAIDQVYLTKNVFRGPIPVYKDLAVHEDFKTPMSLRFWTRGLPPSLVENLVDTPDRLFPHDTNGRMLFQAGDLMFIRKSNPGTAPTFAILSRSVLTKNIKERADELALRAAVVSPEVFSSLDAQLIASLESTLNEPSNPTPAGAPSPNLATQSIDALSQAAFRAIPGEAVKRLLVQAERLADSSRIYDQSLLNEWKGSYSLQRKQSEKSGTPVSPTADFSSQWQELLQAALADHQEQALKKPGFFKGLGKTLAILTGIAAGAGLAYGADAHTVMVALDYLYEHATPPIVKIAEYRFPLFASVVSLMAIIPAAQMFALLSPAAMKTVAEGLKISSRRLSEKLSAMATQWKSLNLWQRLVTMGARVYSVISVTLWNHLGTLLNQPQLFRTLKMGLNPFEQIDPKTELGKKLKLQSSMALGVNSPFLNKTALQKLSFQQQQALQFMTNEKLRSRHVAFQLVALVLYQNQEIDPATLAMLLNEGSIPLDIRKLKDLKPEQQKESLALTEVIVHDWTQTLQTEGALFQSLTAEEFLPLLQIAREKIATYKDSSVLKKRLLVFKEQAHFVFQKLQQEMLLLGVSDAKTLGAAYATPFEADQVKKTFVSDHILVVAFPAFYGDRANPEKATIPGGNADGSDRNLLTFDPTHGSLGSLWTNPEHFMDIWINVCGHFFQGSAGQILLYQGEPLSEETRYLPAEQYLLPQKPETEGFLQGATQWVANVADTRQSALGDYYLKTFSRQMRTIQANLILSLTFRFLSTNPTIDQALMGWYLILIGGSWTYRWPWTIIGQGNHLEEQRIGRQTKILRDHQIALSQALRMDDREAVSLQTEALLNLYKPNNKRLEALTQHLGTMPSETQSPGFKRWSQRLLSYSLKEESPYATQPHPLPSWLSTWSGAISTTYLAIPLGILSLDPYYLTPSNLAIETAVAAAWYVGAYVVIGQQGLWSKTLDRMDSIFQRFKQKLRTPEVKESLSVSCQKTLK